MKYFSKTPQIKRIWNFMVQRGSSGSLEMAVKSFASQKTNKLSLQVVK
jgi:hypothetical protein